MLRVISGSSIGSPPALTLPPQDLPPQNLPPQNLPGILPGEYHPMPLPRPVPPGGERPPTEVPGSPPTIERIMGTAASEQIILTPGAFAAGAGGADSFVLTSRGPHDGSEFLGSIVDFDEDDHLILMELGSNAQVLAREAPKLTWGMDRVSIDYDGDGDEDGHLFVSSGKLPDLGDYQPYPMPTPGDRPLPVEPLPGTEIGGPVTIQPWPLPGEVTIQPWPLPGAADGPVTIQPYPLPGEVIILPYPFPETQPGTSPSPSWDAAWSPLAEGEAMIVVASPLFIGGWFE